MREELSGTEHRTVRETPRETQTYPNTLQLGAVEENLKEVHENLRKISMAD